jgi:hypothetical protein
VLYPKKRRNRYPQWIAGVGDMLRTLGLLHSYGFAFDENPSLRWLLDGFQPVGGVRTARGFGRVTPVEKPDDPRDALSICGWADKAFRYLTGFPEIHAEHLTKA